MSRAKRTYRSAEQMARRRLERALRQLPGTSLATAEGSGLVGLAADEDPELGLIGVVSLRQAAEVC